MTPPGPLRLAVVGVGWAGTRQAESVAELNRRGPSRLEVVCLVDPDAAHLATRSAELGVSRTSTHIDEILRDRDVDAITICSPHPDHCQQAIAAAEAGKHVLVEKPMAMTVDEATRMIAAADAAGVCLYVAESAVYQPIAPFLRQVLQSRRWIGELTAAQMSAGFCAPDYGYADRRAWLAQPDKGGLGTWMLHGIHTVAQVQSVFGEIATVWARDHRASSFRREDVEATVSAALTLSSGVTVQVLQTAETSLPPQLAGYVLHGDRGSLHAHGNSCRVYTDDGVQTVDIPAPQLSEHALELLAFVDHIAGTPGPTTGVTERRSLAVVQAGYESMTHGTTVSLRQRFGAI